MADQTFILEPLGERSAFSTTIEVVEGPHQGKHWTINAPQSVVFGRSEPAQIRLPNEPAMSRQHFELSVREGQVELRDLASSNGTQVNGIRIQSASLQSDDQLRVGTSVLRVSFTEPSATLGDPGHTNDVFDWGIVPQVSAENVDKPELEIATPRQSTVNVQLSADTDENLGHTMLAEQFPESVGDYRLEKLIGQGGMSTVHLAKHLRSGESVAVKLIHTHLAGQAKSNRMFLREASVLTRLDYPCIVRAIEFGTEGSTPYFVMERIESIELLKLMESKAAEQRVKIATYVVFSVLQALHYLHGEGIVHRDIKPSNVLAYREGRHLRVKLADFGLAKCYEDAGMSQMTNERSIRGTLAFMAPEQFENSRDAGPLVDLFACGAMLYEWTTGHLPDMIRGPAGTLAKLDQASQVPDELKAIIRRAIEVNPVDRYQSAKELGAVLFPFHGKR